MSDSILVRPATPKLVDMLSDELMTWPATARVVNFAEAKEVVHRRDDEGNMVEFIVDDRPSMRNDAAINGAGNSDVLLTKKQIRRRAKRRLRRGKRLADEAFNMLYKPIEEWDEEELARGRPRNAAGNFSGAPPGIVTREIHERAMDRFKALIREGMNVQTFTALRTVQMVLESEEVDHRGKPLVSANVKLDAAKWLMEHVVGKPKQQVEADVSVKLQGILGTVMVNPGQVQTNEEYLAAHISPRAITGASGDQMGVIDADLVDDDDD